MAMTDKGETPLIHGLNLKENIRKRIRLMQEHMEDEPYIDPDYIEKMAGRPMS
jgi:mannitol/fructose-specific phosphotransferase system IIA component